jgi:SAM-dependent methyltransferase
MNTPNSISRHYEELLATHYSWMSGMTIDEKIHEQQKLLLDLGVKTEQKGLAVDLGSGPGYQSFALANLGYEKVFAVDTSRKLLNELEAYKAEQPVVTLLADLRAFAQFVGLGSVSAIVCMGDTLTHLDNRADVTKLFCDAFSTLEPDGTLILTFRDFSSELYGLDRIIPVRSDEERIMTCILDYNATNVMVSDLVHIRENGSWTLHKSSYQKLRLSPASLVAELEELGFKVDVDRPAGRMHAICARKLN